MKPWRRFVWLVGPALGAVVLLCLTGWYFWLAQGLPRLRRPEDYRPLRAVEVLSADGRLVGEIYRERRYPVPLERIPPVVVEAFLAAEDARFFEHSGVDLRGVLRALWKDLLAGRVVQGGSTITQQVARCFLGRQRTLRRKLRETILARDLERHLTKRQILNIYLNQIYLGEGAYGVEAAARTYFGKHVEDLNLAEAAMLAGLTPAPSRYSPFRHPEEAKARQRYVLRRMVEEGFIRADEAEVALEMPLRLRRPSGTAFPWWMALVRSRLEERYGEGMYRRLSRVYLAMDCDLQRAAQEALRRGLAAYEARHPESRNRVEGALVCMDVLNGYVRAMVGGRDFGRSQFNRALQARRPPGSAFKPIVYAAALDHGYTPATLVMDEPVRFEDPATGRVWEPQNYDRRFHGPTTLREALTHSRNVVTVKVLRDIGVPQAIAYARRLGIRSALAQDLTLALGTSGVSLLELTRAYAAFANGGMRVRPLFVLEVVGANGEVLERHPPRRERALSPETAYLITSMLQSVVEEGTGRRVRTLGRPCAGKTGTSDGFRDAWFVGFTPQLVTGVWVGMDDGSSLGEGETGARAAAPIWLEFMRRACAGFPPVEFPVPPGIVFVEIDPTTGLPPMPDSTVTTFEAFRRGTEPHAPFSP